MPHASTRCCKNCSLWDIDSARGPSGRLRPDAVALCLWVSTEIYPQHFFLFASRPKGGYCTSKDGTSCLVFKERT